MNVMVTMQSGLKGTNLYEYCENNAVNREDYTGRWSFKLTNYQAWKVTVASGIIGVIAKKLLVKRMARMTFIRLLSLRLVLYASKLAVIMNAVLAVAIVAVIAYYAWKISTGIRYAVYKGRGVGFTFRWRKLSWKLA